MGQGIYWVQRHRDDQRKVSRAAAADRQRNERAQATARARLERALRLLTNVVNFFERQGDIDVNAVGKRRIEAAQDRWEEARTPVMAEGQQVSVASLSKFATTGRSLIVLFARLSGLEPHWDAGSKQLMVGEEILDFS